MDDSARHRDEAQEGKDKDEYYENRNNKESDIHRWKAGIRSGRVEESVMTRADDVPDCIEGVGAGAAGRKVEASGKKAFEVEILHGRIVQRIELQLLRNERFVGGANGVPASLYRGGAFLPACRHE